MKNNKIEVIPESEVENSEFEGMATLEDFVTKDEDPAPEAEQQEEEVEQESQEEEQEEESQESEDSQEEEQETEDSHEEHEEQEEDGSEESDAEESQEDDAQEEEEILEETPVDISSLTDGMFEDESSLKEFLSAVKDPWVKGLIDYYKETGNAAPYLEASRHDFSKMSDLDVLRIQHASEYSDIEDLTQDDLNELFETDVLSKYGLSDLDEDSEDFARKKRIADAKIKKDAQKVRSQLVDEQKRFMAPPVREEQKQPSESELQAKKVKALTSAKKLVNESLKDGKVSLTVGDSEIQIGVDKKSMVDLIADSKNVLKSVVKDGKIDFVKLSFLSNPDAFISKVQKEISASAQKEIVNRDLKNKKEKNSSAEKRNPSPEELNNPYSIASIKGMRVVK